MDNAFTTLVTSFIQLCRILNTWKLNCKSFVLLQISLLIQVKTAFVYHKTLPVSWSFHRYLQKVDLVANVRSNLRAVFDLERKNRQYGWYLVNVLVIVYILLQTVQTEIGVVFAEFLSVYSEGFEIKKHLTKARDWSFEKRYLNYLEKPNTSNNWPCTKNVYFHFAQFFDLESHK